MFTADILLRLNRHSEAEEVYRHLLGITIDNYSYHAGLRAALGIAPTKRYLRYWHPNLCSGVPY